MNISTDTQVKFINDLLSYINSKEEQKKVETQLFNSQNREKFLAYRNQHCHIKEERDISSEEDAQRTKRNHYKRIGDNYESLWRFEDQYQSTLLNDVYTLLDIKENDVIADLGGGTGYWTEKIKQAHSTCDMLLVEPCQKMLEEGRNREDLELFLMNEHKFLESDIYFNKMMIKGCIHHFKDIPAFLDKLYEKLPEGGRALVLTLNDEGYCLPYPEVVHSYLRKLRSEYDFMQQFYNKPWFSQIIHRQYPASITQEEVRRIVKGRFTSTLSLFTDEQLASGLEEQFKGKDSQEMINFIYSESLLMMEKPFNIKITDEDMTHMSYKLQAIGISDEVKVEMQMFDLKIKLQKMLKSIN